MRHYDTLPHIQSVAVCLLLLLMATACAGSALPTEDYSRTTPISKATAAFTQTAAPSPSPTAAATLSPSTTPTVNLFDDSTPAPPDGDWATYAHPESGLNFQYPSNWFVTEEAQYNRIRIQNAPPGGIFSVKNTSLDFIHIQIDLPPISIAEYESLLVYLQENEDYTQLEAVSCYTPDCQIVHLISSSFGGAGEHDAYYIAHNDRAIHIGVDYPAGTQKTYLYILELIAQTMLCCNY